MTEHAPMKEPAADIDAFAVTDEQHALRAAIRSALVALSPTSSVREHMTTDSPFDAVLWRTLTEQMGLSALMIPEQYGGAGFSFVETSIVCEELGRSLACVPFLSSAVLAAAVLIECGTSEAKRELLPVVASGQMRLAVALIDAGNPGWSGEHTTMEAREISGSLRLSGVKRFVIDGLAADGLLVVARQSDGLSVLLVDALSPDITRRPLTALDQTRGLADVEMHDASATLVSEPGAATQGLRRALATATAAVVAESVGGSERCLSMAVDYAKSRYQFGRPIGSYQAISHTCADMFADLELARSTSQSAAFTVAASSSISECRIAVSTAKAFTSDAFLKIAGDNIQIHGGIGFTWEHDAHLFFKRAKSNHQLFGDPFDHRNILAGELGL
jgi:alkylation response protein AidB-like acyl-CoA dehydrogenase